MTEYSLLFIPQRYRSIQEIKNIGTLIDNNILKEFLQKYDSCLSKVLFLSCYDRIYGQKIFDSIQTKYVVGVLPYIYSQKNPLTVNCLKNFLEQLPYQNQEDEDKVTISYTINSIMITIKQGALYTPFEEFIHTYLLQILPAGMTIQTNIVYNDSKTTIIAFKDNTVESLKEKTIEQLKTGV